MNKGFEKELPTNYKVVWHMNAMTTKVGLIMNAIALLVMFMVMLVATLIYTTNKSFPTLEEASSQFWIIIVGLISMIVYVVLHELVHGIAYKALTKQKLTFGLSWSCAYCGVPDIFVYRKVALIALAAPLTVFGIIFLITTIIFYEVSAVAFLVSAFLLGFHLGGCSGDILLLIKFMKFKDKDILLKDTGPEQFIYMKE